MKEKKSFFLWLFLFVLLTTYSVESHNKFNNFFPIKIIRVDGIKNSDEEKINGGLNKFKGKSIIFLSRHEIKKTIINFKFIKALKIKKIYPDTIEVTIIENEPIGVLFRNNKKYLITEGENLLEDYPHEKFNFLPEVHGKGAKENFSNFYNSLKRVKFNIELIDQFFYFQVNRWDIILKDDKLVKLPVENYEISLVKFLSIYEKKNFLNFKVFDFRMRGQLILK